MAVTPMLVFAYNHPSKKASIYGEVDDQGDVTLAILATPDSPVRGTELFRRMMLAFGMDAKRIHGVWRKGKSPSINIDEVNKLTGAALSLEDAVLQAWTVTRARKLGFLKVSVINHEGQPGHYSKIDVMIEK
jgi:hypothetical protein